MDVTCVPARPDDADILVGMIRQYYELDGIPFNEKTLRPALDRLLHDDSLGRACLIRREGEVAGYFILTFDYSLEFAGREVFVDELFVKEIHRGRGVGTKALEYIEQECRAMGIRAIHLGVEVENVKAQSVYRKFGFGPPERYLLTKVLAP